MGYKWLPVTEDFDKTLVIKKWRFDVSIPISGNYDGALSELPNIDIKTCWNNPQAENGYAFSNRFNLGQKYFSSRYYGWTDKHWTATTEAHTTLVSGTTYEFECPVDLYWAGVRETTFNPNIPNYMWFYVNASSFETDITAITASYNSTTSAVTLTADEDMSWTASTNDSWITVSPASGTGSSAITISISANNNYSSRVGTVDITNGEDTIEIVCSQAKYPLLVPSENIYRSGNEVVKLYRSGSSINRMYRSGALIYQSLISSGSPTPPSPFLTEYLTFEILSSGTINWVDYGGDFNLNIEYDINGDEDWQTLTSDQYSPATIFVNDGDIVRFRGDNGTYGTQATNTSFQGTTAVFNVYGNIMSLVLSVGFESYDTLDDTYTFSNLFRDCTGLTDASNLLLPATGLADGCYNYMFSGCTSLTQAPELPATTLARYCYYAMFRECTSLTTAPALPATELSQQCYYRMFSDCTSLTTAPELPATTLTQSCYNYMFYGCTSLNYIKCLVEDNSVGISTTYRWVEGVAANGTFVKDASMTSWTTGNNGIPENWTVQDA